MRLIFKIFDYLAKHTKVLWIALVASFVLFALAIANFRFSEDVADFLPLDNSEQEALAVYQNISGANRLYILFNNPDDADTTIQAIDHFETKVKEQDSQNWCADLTTRFDMERVMELSTFVYDNIPYFLTTADYEHMEALLSNEEYISDQMHRNLEMLMLPSGGVLSRNIMRDPLALFTPVMSGMQSANMQMSFEMYDGYIFTPDMSRAVVMMSSPFGNSETEYNSKLVALLNNAIESVEQRFPTVSAHVVGGPEIAVGNASRIKKDSILAIALSVILITLLVIYSINSLRNVLLIFLSIGWGWLLSLAGMALIGGEVSIIVVGISSVILGIAVNYPLHLIVHLPHSTSVREAIKDIIAPLVIGNITTVGAFLTLIPLQSVALRDLGLFASLLLVGTILFVLIFLPHFVKSNNNSGERRGKLLDYIAALSPEKSKVVVLGTILITIVLAFFGRHTEFDSNIANCNYMTKEQRSDMAYFQALFSKSNNRTTQELYVLSSGKDFDQALRHNAEVVPTIDSLVAEGKISSYRGVERFLVSQQEQQRRLEMWRDFTSKHRESLTTKLRAEAQKCGFAPEAFADFEQVVTKCNFTPQSIAYFEPLTKSLFSQNITEIKERDKAYVINVLNVEKEHFEEVKSRFDDSFDVVGMNSALANNLSDNFNYIGWACSIIVFLFLWYSFGRIELAIISFIPMAISWVWILGIMALLGVKFNIVNVILATFIFGQGDDYTIFMTEGCQYEYRHRRPILTSYKNSILQSALIMFVGIGTLIVSQHPAMRSLAEVTIIGMASVLFMSYTIPPLLFGWLTTKGGTYRQHPVTLRTLLFGNPNTPMARVRGRYIYKGKQIMRAVDANLRCFDANINYHHDEEGNILFEEKGYGEQALLVALTHPDIVVIAHIEDEERCEIARVAATDFVNNIKFYV